ncbi:MAG TPA: DHA2 family efflux MFS transporter permease subunit [Candidatus Dormibacteraeota bacterium]|jgi:EmrB/QacA subfamily drug resistance transporter
MISSGARRWLAAAALTLGVLAVGLDVTVLSVALPTLAASLRATESDLQWFSSGYALTLAAGMLPAGVLGDRFGRKRVMLGALVLFGAGSVVCAFSPSPAVFIAARVVLGAAGAAMVVMVLSIFTVLFSEEERPRVVGIWAAANFLALPIGPLLGGWLLTNYWWGWVFLMNLPVAALGLIAVIALVPESRAQERPALDPIGMVAASGGLAAVTYGLIGLGRLGWTDPGSLVILAAGVLVLCGFFAWERRLTSRPGGRPLIELALFKSRGFTWGVILAALGGMSLFGIIFTMPQYSQGVLGLDPQGAGLRLLPVILGLVVGAVPADRIAAAIGPKLTVAAGFAITTGGLVVGATTAIGTSDWFSATWMAVVGFGMGIAFATAASAALKTVPSERSGVASALVQAMQKVGAPLGSAILGSVLASEYRSQLNLGGLPAGVAEPIRQSVFAGVAVAEKLHSPALLSSVRHAFVHGMDAAFLVSAGMAILGIVLALAFMPGRTATTHEAATLPVTEAKSVA